MSINTSKYSKYKEKNDIFPHKHCSICFKLIPEEDWEFGEYCSLECQNQTESQKKGKKKRTIFMIGSYAVMIVVFIVITIINR